MSEIIVGDAREIGDIGKFSIILADPPWFYNDQRKIRKGEGRIPTKGIGACHHYSLLKTPEICKLKIGKLAAERCHLLLWATCPLLPDALKAMDAWGFKWATVAFVFLKINPGIWRVARGLLARTLLAKGLPSFLAWIAYYGPGFYTGSNIELVLLGRKGKPFPHARGHKASQVVFAPRGKHSAKPEAVQDRIEEMWPDATPRLELFARRPREGWTVFGLEADGKALERMSDERNYGLWHCTRSERKMETKPSTFVYYL